MPLHILVECYEDGPSKGGRGCPLTIIMDCTLCLSGTLRDSWANWGIGVGGEVCKKVNSFFYFVIHLLSYGRLVCRKDWLVGDLKPLCQIPRKTGEITQRACDTTLSFLWPGLTPTKALQPP